VSHGDLEGAKMDDNKYQLYAERIRIFNGLKPEEVDFILHHGRMLEYVKGQTIFHAGQLGDSLFVLLGGKVGIYNKSKLIAKCGVGDAFGEIAVLTHKPRSATAAALEDSRLFILNEKEINELLQKHVAVRLLMNIIHVLCERLEIADSALADLRPQV
jgi:CRP/FNR family transcriptional regulator